MSLCLSFREKEVDRSKSDTVPIFYKHKHYASANVHTVFLLPFPSDQQSHSMDEIIMNACAEINNKQNYLPSYFLLNLVLEIT